MEGATLPGVVERVSDGDTVRLEAAGLRLKLRIFGLDAEESNPGGDKPVTPWGRAASAFVSEILPVGAPATIEFPGRQDPIVAGALNPAYLDNIGRPLGFVHLAEPIDGVRDLTEIMIRRGFSPYFVKYGRAPFAAYDRAYLAAERAAQAEDIGVWNQFASNGVRNPEDAPRNYPRLTVWWELRARLIDEFRAAKTRWPQAPLFNTRLDYAKLLEVARAGETATMFMELRTGVELEDGAYAFRSRARAQPFQLFLPDLRRPEIEAVRHMIANRYTAETERFPRRNYAYATGPCRMRRGRPEMVIERLDQITDAPPDFDR